VCRYFILIIEGSTVHSSEIKAKKEIGFEYYCWFFFIIDWIYFFI